MATIILMPQTGRSSASRGTAARFIAGKMSAGSSSTGHGAVQTHFARLIHHAHPARAISLKVRNLPKYGAEAAKLTIEFAPSSARQSNQAGAGIRELAPSARLPQHRAHVPICGS